MLYVPLLEMCYCIYLQKMSFSFKRNFYDARSHHNLVFFHLMNQCSFHHFYCGSVLNIKVSSRTFALASKNQASTPRVIVNKDD